MGNISQSGRAKFFPVETGKHNINSIMVRFDKNMTTIHQPKTRKLGYYLMISIFNIK